MARPLESETETGELARLRRCLNDLVGISVLPALCVGGEPAEIVDTLLDALRETLRPAFIYVRLTPADDDTVGEFVRLGAPLGRRPTARGVGRQLDLAFGSEPTQWPPSARLSLFGAELQIASARLGIRGEIGVLVAGCHRREFPDQTERLLLNVAVNQATVGLQQTRLLGEQRRLARSLDEQVAHRTRELAAANEALNAEVAERRRAEQALRDRERESRLIVDSLPGCVALLTADGEVDVANGQLLAYFGQPLDELRRWGTNGTVHPDDLPRVGTVFRRAIASGERYLIVQRLRRADGVYRWFENSGVPVRDDAGNVARWCVLLTDVDDRARAEDALKRSERQLQLNIDTMPALVWSTGQDGAADFFNQHYLDYVGLTVEEARGWGWTSAVHPDDLGSLASTWQRLLATASPGEAEARMRRHDGEYRWFLFRTNPLRDDTGAVVNWYGVNTDIEDRKRAEAELRRAYDSFATAQRLSRTGNLSVDLVADEHVWSEELYRIFEFDPGERIRMSAVRDVIHPEDLPSFDARMARSLEGADFDVVFRIVVSSRRVKHLHSVGRVIERVAGRPVFVGAIQDVTESKLAEEALSRARSELAHVARVATINTLTASIAHEVSQPLAGIITNTGTCLRMLGATPPNVEGARETVRRAMRDGLRASEVMKRLRTLFSKREFTLEPLDLNDAIEEVVALSLADMQRGRVAVRVELADALPVVVGDRVQLQQVVLNLLLNAADAMREVEDRARDLTVRTEHEAADRVRVSVCDSGTGVDPQQLEQLFDAFYTTKRGGMGIGLSVSRSIIERHDGRLWATPNDGPGATFAFSLPCRSRTAAT